MSTTAIEILGESESPKGIEPLVGNRADILGLFFDEECIGVKDRPDVGLIEPSDDSAIRLPTCGSFVGAESEITKPEEPAAAVMVNLGDPKLLGHRNPFIHVRFREAAEVE